MVAGCSETTEGEAVVATVDGLAMTEDEVLRSYVDYLISSGQNDTAALRRRHVEALVDAYLLGAEAERRGLGDDSAFAAASELARRRLVGARFFEASAIDTLAGVTDEEMREAYRLGEEKRLVRQLYFTSEAAAQASFERLEGGRSFAEEAQILYGTDDPSAGSLGAVGYWQLDDAFSEAAFATPVGAYSAPFRSRLGYHIVYVEDRFRNPVLTEDQFLRSREGVASQIRLRRRRLEGDGFVRAFMEAREVAVNRPALRALGQAIADLEGDALPDAQQGQREPFTPGQQSQIAEALGPDTPLASFELGGERRTFRLADYLFWLDALPPTEVRTRVGASLGRALRNEALALAGEAAGIDEDPDVQRELARGERLRLADALRAELRAQAPADADTTRLGSIARDLGLAPRRRVADYWMVPFSSREAAEAALSGLRAAPEHARALPGFRAAEDGALSEAGPIAAAVASAPLGEVVLASLGEDRFAVLRVADRRVEATATGAEVLAPLAAEADLVRRLRQERPVAIDDDVLDRLAAPPQVPAGRR